MSNIKSISCEMGRVLSGEINRAYVISRRAKECLA